LEGDRGGGFSDTLKINDKTPIHKAIIIIPNKAKSFFRLIPAVTFGLEKQSLFLLQMRKPKKW